MFELYSQNYAARALPILFNTPKKSLLKSSYPKKYLPNFRTQKNPGIEHFKPKKILRSSPSLEIPSIPPGYKSKSVKKFLFFCFLPSENLAFSLAIFRKFCFFTTSPQKIWSSFLQPTSEIPCFCLLLWKILSAGGVY